MYTYIIYIDIIYVVIPKNVLKNHAVELVRLDQNILQGYSSLFSRLKCKKGNNKHGWL